MSSSIDHYGLRPRDKHTQQMKFRFLTDPLNEEKPVICASCSLTGTVAFIIRHYDFHHQRKSQRIMRTPEFDNSIKRSEGIPNIRYSINKAAQKWVAINSHQAKESRQYKCIVDSCIANIIQDNDAWAASRTAKTMFEHIEKHHVDIVCRKPVSISQLWLTIHKLHARAAFNIAGHRQYKNFLRGRSASSATQ